MIHNEEVTNDAPEKEKAEAMLSWDEHHMAVALLASLRSKDPSTKVGAAIVSERERVISTGYNGFPLSTLESSNNDDLYTWDREGEENKYDFVVHAEANAITAGIAPGTALNGARLYVTLFPCNECAKLIIQSGIAEVVYLSDKYKDTKSSKLSRRMLENAHVRIREFKSEKLSGVGLHFQDSNLNHVKFKKDIISDRERECYEREN